MLKHLSGKLGLTGTELKIFLFMSLILTAGSIYKHYKDQEAVTVKVFDYSRTDSLFNAAGYEIHPPETGGKGEKKFDYKQEVLDFNTRNFNEVKPEKTAVEKSIDINSAGSEELLTIPGLGEKTVQKILEYRTRTGSFKSLEELMNVKGIGEKKYNKIKNYVYIE